MRISVVIPVHNEEKYIGRCLESLEGQTFEEIEIICVDDQSTDNSLAIIKEHAERDSRIRIITIDKSGAAVARNIGIDNAMGDYLAILDADDEYNPRMLETMLKQIIADGSDICVCGSEYIDAVTGELLPIESALNTALLPESPFDPTSIADDILMCCVGWSWDKLFSRDYINRRGLRFQSIPNSEDAYFVFMAMMLADKISYTSEILTTHRNNKEGSVSSPKLRSQNWQCMFLAMNALYIGLYNNNKYEVYEKGFVRWTASFSKWYITTLEQPYRDDAIKHMKDMLIPKLSLDSFGIEYFNSTDDYYWIKALVCLPVGKDVHYGDTLISFYHLISNMGESIRQKEIAISNLSYALDMYGVKLDESKKVKLTASYRIGRFFTWLPRRAVGAFRALRQHGIGFVLVRLFGGKKRAEALHEKREAKALAIKAEMAYAATNDETTANEHQKDAI